MGTGAYVRGASAGVVRAAAATVAALVGGAAPALVFWFAVRGAGGAYPAGSEVLVLTATPLLAGFAFALLAPAPVLRWSAGFAAALAVPLALLVILVIYRGDMEGLGSAPLAAIATWVLCWIEGFVGAAMANGLRNWAAEVRAVSAEVWLQAWWTRRTCPHEWEVVESHETLGSPLGRATWAPRNVTRRTMYTSSCNICGAKKTRSDRWGPA